MTQDRSVVAIPAKDEQDHMGRCLRALREQSVEADAILLFLNNCTDRTAEICRGFTFGINLVIIEENLTGDAATAGEARRRVLKHAEQQFPKNVILTTDADSQPPGDWIERNLHALRSGAQIVCGRAELFEADAAQIRKALHEDNRRETTLLSLLDEIDWLINPTPCDPWPRHITDSGASIALRPGVLRRIGGAPPVAFAEDRALIERCRMLDMKIRHDPDILVRVSGRLEGRAIGGMAETIKRRSTRQDAMADARIEPAEDAYRRSLLKARLRACWQGNAPVSGLAAALGMAEDAVASLAAAPYFGAAWAAVESFSPSLRRRRVAYPELDQETLRALQIRDRLLHACERELVSKAMA